MKPPKRTRSRWIRHALILHYYYSLALGIVSLRYNFRQRQFTRAPLLQVYALLMNALMVGLIPLAIHHGMGVMHFPGANQLMTLTHIVNVYVRTAVITLTLLWRWRRERHAKAIVDQLLEMEAEYFDAVAVPSHIQRRFERIFAAKYCSYLMQTAGVVYTFAVVSHMASIWTLLFYVYVLGLLNVLLGVMFHYFVALWHICERFCLLNAQLVAVFRKLRRYQRSKSGSTASELLQLSGEVHTIARLHYRLTQLVVQLNDIYKYQIMGVLLTQILNNTATAYYALMLRTTTDKSLNSTNYTAFNRLLRIGLFSIVLLDMFLFDVIFDAIMVESQATATQLKRFQELVVVETPLIQSCHLLSQHLMRHKLRVEICGMFALNKHSAFIIFGATIKQVVVLMQFDMERRFG